MHVFGKQDFYRQTENLKIKKRSGQMDEMVELIEEEQKKVAKLKMQYVAISKSETINHSLTH